MMRHLAWTAALAVALSGAAFGRGLTDDRTAAGLREALEVGLGRAVHRVGKLDGYFKNPEIKIPLPGALRPAEKVMRAFGQGRQVDEFVLSMNRAAETAAPEAIGIFTDAIRTLTFDDARRILTDGDTAATQFLKRKTSGKLAEAFDPIVRKEMDMHGVTRRYKELTGRLDALPVGGIGSLDLDRYVVNEALDGLFHVVGQEERKIRRNPARRVTDLLKDVFGR